MNFVNSMAFTAITFVAFTALVALISWWKTRGDNLDTQDGYYLGGRSLTGPVIAGSLLMTNLSAEQLVGNNGQAVRVGMSTMGWEVTSAIALVILAFVLMPKYLKTGLTTVPQFFEQRYDEGTRRLVSIIVLLSYVVIMLPNILYAGAQVFVNIFGIDKMFGISRFAAIAIVCVATAIVGSIYAIFGGLKAIALSDSINGLGLIVGGLLVPVFGFMFLSGQLGGDGSFMDGFDKFLHTNPSYLNAINEVNTPEPWLPWPLLFTGLLVNNMYYWATNQSIIQRTFGAKNLKEAQKGARICRLPQDHDSADHRCSGRYLRTGLPGHRLGFRRLRLPDAGSTGYAEADPGLLRCCNVRRDPVLLQLGTELRIHHLRTRYSPSAVQPDRFRCTHG